MKFLIYSEVSASRIASSLGLSEYSYYFVLKEFLPVLESLGEVIVVDNPRSQVDKLYRQAKAAGEACFFLSFTPVHKTEFKLRCPTIPVFAWEFDSIPCEYWLGDQQQDWRLGLARSGRAITHSNLTLKTVHEAMGQYYPVASIPAPVWDKYASFRQRQMLPRSSSARQIKVSSGVVIDTHDASYALYMPDPQAVALAVAIARGAGVVIDTHNAPQAPYMPDQQAAALAVAVREQEASAQSVELPTTRQETLGRITYRYLLEWYRLVGRDQLQGFWRTAKQWLLRKPVSVVVEKVEEPLSPIWQLKEQSLELDGVVFTALFNPYDGRKNWADMLTAFCAAFRDTSNATLVFKLGSKEYLSVMNIMLITLARLPKFRCRIVLLQGFLEGESFEALIEATSFAVNASYGEGQCLPLMEFLSCGRPAVAPRHSAMADYIDEDVAFVVDSWLDATCWPHDPRQAFRTRRHQIDWESLVEAYKAAYKCATETPDRYAQMSRNAIELMQSHCSQQVAKERIKDFLNIKEQPHVHH